MSGHLSSGTDRQGDGRPDGALTPRPDTERQIGGFLLVREVGRGGMGEVWLGFDPKLQRQVAIKMMRGEIADDPGSVQRFYREAQAVARLNHPHIIQIYTMGEDQGSLYFVMEWVDGETLSTRIRESGALARREALRVVRQAAEGLECACNAGIIHRDIKPGNIMLDSAGRVKIADFGLAMLADHSTRMTRTGTTVGTPNYMSPEACCGNDADHRTDIYSLGITFYQLLTGELPFAAGTPMTVMFRHVNEPLPEPPALRLLDQGIWMDVLLRMTAKSPDQRYRTYSELLSALDQLESASAGAQGAIPATGVPGPDTPARQTPRVSPVSPLSALPMPGRPDETSVTHQAPWAVPRPGPAPAFPLPAEPLHHVQPAPPVRTPRRWPWALAWISGGVAALAVVGAGSLYVYDRLALPSPAGASAVAAVPQPSPVASPVASGASAPAVGQAFGEGGGALPPKQTTAEVLFAGRADMQSAFRSFDFGTLASLIQELADSRDMDAPTRSRLEPYLTAARSLRGFREDLVSRAEAGPGSAVLDRAGLGPLKLVGGDSEGLRFMSASSSPVVLSWEDLPAEEFVWLRFQLTAPRDRNVLLPLVQAFEMFYRGAARVHLPPPPEGHMRPGGVLGHGGHGPGGQSPADLRSGVQPGRQPVHGPGRRPGDFPMMPPSPQQPRP